MTNFDVAYQLAADLAGARVDPNEAMKALAYARSRRSGRALFDYLGAVVNNGQAVIRSRQTLEYYREILTACERHLRPLRSDDAALLQTFAWSLRLLRYYRAVPDMQPTMMQSPTTQDIATLSSALSPTVPRPARAIPEIGDLFTGKILDVDTDSGDVAVEVPGFATDKAIGRIKAENLGGKKFRTDNSARVEVIDVRLLKNGRTLLELRPAQKPGGQPS